MSEEEREAAERLLDHLRRVDQTLTAAVNEAARAGLDITAGLIDHNRAQIGTIRANTARNLEYV